MTVSPLTPGLSTGLPAGLSAGTNQHGTDGELRSVSIAVAVLDCFVQSAELGPTQVARRMGIAKSTASRMLSALSAGGMLERAEGGRYRLSVRLFHYGQLAVDRLPLRAIARPVMADLHGGVREVVQLAIPAQGFVLHVDRVGEPGLTGRRAPEVLRRVPGYSSSAGRVMAAFDPEIAQQTLELPRTRRTAHTVTDDAVLREAIRDAGRRGWAYARDQVEVGLSSLAVPILCPGPDGQRVVGALSVIGTTASILGPRKDFVVAGATRAARRIATAVAAVEGDVWEPTPLVGTSTQARTGHVRARRSNE